MEGGGWRGGGLRVDGAEGRKGRWRVEGVEVESGEGGGWRLEKWRWRGGGCAR